MVFSPPGKTLKTLNSPQKRQSLRPVTPPRPVAPLFDPNLAPQILDGAKREWWQQGEKIVRALRIPLGAIVADIGAGSGYLTPFLSAAVGAKGVVFAEEIQLAFLPTLRSVARETGNVQVIFGKPEDPRLPRRDVSLFVLLTVYHEVQNPILFLQILHRYSAPNARLAIIDFDPNLNGSPPPPKGHAVPEKTVRGEAEAAGWIVEKSFAFQRPHSQYFLVFRRK